MSAQPPPTYYEILGISPSAIYDASHPSSSHLIKRAYRRALLNHHPDKQQRHKPSTTHPNSTNKFTIDQISQAFAVLSTPSRRAEYDAQLRLLRSTTSGSTHSTTTGGTPTLNFQTGIENVDLDDLESFFCDDDDDDEGEESTTTTTAAARGLSGDTTTKWFRSCRCGNPRGYLFSEADLEEAADLGELMVGCADCSLWLRVHFAVLEDEEGEDEEDQRRGGGSSGGEGGGKEGRD